MPCSSDTYPALTDMIGGGPFGLKLGQWTDDTAMALALADSLAKTPALDENDLMQRFVDWHVHGTYSCTGHCFDIGITTRQALTRWQKTGDPFAGSPDPMSAGNGSLMRLAPVATCVADAEVLANAIAGAKRSAVLRPRNDGYAGQIAPIMAGSWRGKARGAIRASGYVAHSLEASLWSVARIGGYSDAVLLAANLGEDADTTGAIAG
jgi:ADP-ribosyl-[dinitrogen reductase] hydrolase